MRRSAATALAAVPIVVGTFLVQVIDAAPAAAHAELASSQPAAGSRVATLPDVARLTFTEVVGQPAALTVTGPDGTDIATGDVEVVDDTLSRSLDAEGDLSNGTYTMTYQVTSADGHPISGSVDFTLTSGQEAQAAPESDPAAVGASGVSTAMVTVLAAGFALALGVAVFSIGRLVGRASDG